MIEVTDLRFCKRLAEHSHAVLPLLVTEHREPFNVGEVFDAELEVVPGRTGVPATESGHVEQHAQLPVLPNEPFNLWHKLLIIRLYQLAADVNDEQLAVVFFIEGTSKNSEFAQIQGAETISLRRICVICKQEIFSATQQLG
ncbi:MAG: hypothetical protein WB870_16005 [Gallionellaceae bacterium]